MTNSDFPPLIISSISINYGDRNEEDLTSQSGHTVATTYVSDIIGTTIQVSFALTRTELLSLFNHFNDKKQSFVGFQFQPQSLIEVDVPSGYSWIYAGQPEIVDVIGDLAYVSCSFMLVPRGGKVFAYGGNIGSGIQIGFQAVGVIPSFTLLEGLAFGTIEGGNFESYHAMPIGIGFEAVGFIEPPIEIEGIGFGNILGGDFTEWIELPFGIDLVYGSQDTSPGNTVFLLKYLEDFRDYSNLSRIYTIHGSPQIIQNGGFYDANHGYFDGSDWIVYANMPFFAGGTGPLTIETYAEPQSYGRIIFSHTQGFNTQGFRHWDDGSLSVYWEGTEIRSAAGLIQLNNIYHYALSREVISPGNTITRLFINGQVVGTTTLMNMNISIDVIGMMYFQSNPNPGTQFIGKLNETRIKDAAIYTTSFIPPDPFSIE